MNLDVAVVGASTAGLFAAEGLARAGWRVGVFEQNTEVSHARRTLIVTPQFSHLLRGHLDGAVLHYTKAIAVNTASARTRIELREPDLVVERSFLAQFLAKRAQEAGANLYTGYHFRALKPHPKGAVLCLSNGASKAVSVRARAVIGADGLHSNVALSAGLNRPPAVHILQAEVQFPSGQDPAVTRVWFDKTENRFFYWLIPQSEERGMVGLIGQNHGQTCALLQRFLDRRQLRAISYQDAHVAMHHPRLRPWGRVGTAPVLLVGDAAGQVKVTTMGGTVPGLWGASAAVGSLVRGTSYARELGPLKRELDLHWLIRLLLDGLGNADYDRLVANLNTAVHDFLGRYTRDQVAGEFWKLPLIQARILILGLRLLLRCINKR